MFPHPETDVRGGYVDFGLICSFISPDGPGHDDDTEDDDSVWPMLRMSLRGEPTYRDDYTDTLVLTGEQVQFMRDHLNVWLARAGIEDGDWHAMEQDRRARWKDDS